MIRLTTHSVFSVLFLISLFSSCKGTNLYTTLSELRDSLNTTNNTISFYCIKEKYALWIEEEKEVDDNWGEKLQTLYYYNLETKETTKLFTTFKDSISRISEADAKGIISGIGEIGASNDSLAILINDFEGDILMLPIKKITPVSILYLGNVIIDDVEPTENFSHFVASEGQYHVQEYIKLPDEIQHLGDQPFWNIKKSHIYTTSGEHISTDPQAQIYDSSGREFIQVPIEMLDDPAELQKEMITHLAYSIEEVSNIANNTVQFDEVFDNKREPEILHYFSLTVHSVKEVADMDHKDKQGNYGKRLRVDGEDFSIYTNDRDFDKLSYPCRVIIQAKVRDVQQLMENPFASMFSGLLGGAGIDTNVRFSFTKATLVYAADQE